jgi:hypothetical protein
MRVTLVAGALFTIVLCVAASAGAAGGTAGLRALFHDRYCPLRAGSAECAAPIVDNQVRQWTALSALCAAKPAADAAVDALCAAFAKLDPPLALSFAPAANRWSPILGLNQDPPRTDVFSSDVNGIPRVNITSGHAVSVVIAPVNPLVYRVKRGDIKEEDIDQLKDLAKLVTAAGGFLTAFAASPRGGELAAARIGPAPDEYAAAFAAERDESAAAARAASNALRDIGNLLERQKAERAALVRLARALDGAPAAGVPARGVLAATDADDEQRATALFDTAAASLDTLAAALDRLPASLVGAYRGMLDLSETDAARVRLAARELAARLELHDAARSGPFTLLMTRDANAIADAPDPEIARRLPELRGKAERYAVRLQAQLSSLAAARDDFGKVIENGGQASADARTLRRLKQRGRASEIGDVVRAAIYVPDDDTPPLWSRIRTFPLTISPQAAIKTELGYDDADDVSSSYKIGHRQSTLFGVGVGLTLTPLASPTWKAVPAPGDPARKVVGRTGADIRSGQVALFANYRLLQAVAPATAGWIVKPGVEAGIAASTDNPGAFLGASFEVLRALRIGVGVTRQRVKALDGQIEGVTIVGSTDEIKTRDVFTNARYVSITFALDTLSLFSTGR